MKSRYGLCLAAIGAFGASPALSTFVVDTGDPTSFGYEFGLPPFNSVAGFVTLNSAITVTSAEWFLGSAGGTAGTITVYDGSQFPHTSTALFSADFNSVATQSWQGVFGQNWNLPAGSYWLGLTMDDPYFLRSHAPNPLARYASTINLAVWTEGPTGPVIGFEFGVRLADDVTAAVPEPATWIMMIGGFGAIGGMLRYRRRRTNVAIG